MEDDQHCPGLNYGLHGKTKRGQKNMGEEDGVGTVNGTHCKSMQHPVADVFQSARFHWLLGD